MSPDQTETGRRAPIPPLAAALIVMLLIGIVGLLALRPTLTAAITPPTATFVPDTPGVTPVDPPQALRDFTLPGVLPGVQPDVIDDEPQALSLSALSDGYTLLAFGYTHCPDFCPLTLAEFTQVKRLLGEDAARVHFLFISVDGARDTPEVMRRYLDNFDPAFYGMSGDDATLAAIAPDYGLHYTLRTDEGRGDNYLVDHSTSSYLVDPQGRLTAIYDYYADPQTIAGDILARLESESA